MMKKIITLICCTLLLSSCFKDYNDFYLLTDQTVEFEDAVANSNATGKYYPILPNVFSIHGTVKYRINMFGSQVAEATHVKYRIVDDESTAIEGRDFEFVTSEDIVIPANSNFGYLEFNVLPSIEGTKVLVVELLGNENVAVSEKYKTIGIAMSNAVLSPDPDVVEDMGDYIYVEDILLGGDENTDLGTFMDLQTANIYTWEGAAIMPEKLTFGYFQSNANFANFVFPGLSSMATAWPVYYNRMLNWPARPTGTLVRFTNTTAVDHQKFEDISSSSDIKDAFDQAVNEVGTRHGSAATYGPGERVRSLKPGDIVFVHSSTSDFYAIIRIKEALENNDVPKSERTIRFEYKVQK